MDSVTERLASVRERIAAAARAAGRDPVEVRLVAVSKTQPPLAIAAAVAAGATEFGENRAQELRDKAPQFGPNVVWHFIGRLQTNKVKYVVPGAALIHSLDRHDLAAEIDRRAARASLRQPVLIEVNTSGEASKGGVGPADLEAFAASLAEFANIEPRGLMTMAAPGDPVAARAAFRRLRELRDQLRAGGTGEWPELSMGMSDDFELAIAEGATIVRIGTAIFGSRH